MKWADTCRPSSSSIGLTQLVIQQRSRGSNCLTQTMTKQIWKWRVARFARFNLRSGHYVGIGNEKRPRRARDLNGVSDNACLPWQWPEMEYSRGNSIICRNQAFGSAARTISTTTLRASSESCTSRRKLMRVPFMPSLVFSRR